MKKLYKKNRGEVVLKLSCLIGLIFFCVFKTQAVDYSVYVLMADTPNTDLPYPTSDDPFGQNTATPFNLNDPKNVDTEVKYDPATQRYTIYKKVGGRYYRYPMTFTTDEYFKYNMGESIQDYWNSKFDAESLTSAKKKKGSDEDKPLLTVDNDGFDKIFGGNSIDIKPQVSAGLTFGVNSSRTDNPAISENQRKITTFNFDQQIQANVVGTIGDKLKIGTSYNTEAVFDFENQMKLDYTGYEDEIIKKIEAGNVSLPLNSSLISGSQSLFGIKTQLQFGRLTATTVFSQQKGEKSEINIQGGAQAQDFEIKADNYEANRHYFLSHFFRAQYDGLMEGLPNINSPINITRVEVWVTNNNNTTEETRNFVAFSDLGEDPAFQTPGGSFTLMDLKGSDNYPDNAQNNIFQEVTSQSDIVGFSKATERLVNMGFEAAVHYEKIESARKLPLTSYTINQPLGFISLNTQPLNNDEVLAVAYQYTYKGETYQVGQFSTDGVNPPNALMLRLLKSTITNPQLPVWDLMMKNIYSMNAFQVNREDFLLNVFYNNPKSGVDINYLPYTGVEKTPLLQVLNMDRLNANNKQQSDGAFDYVDNAATDGGTINARNGRLYMPVVEPFGEHLEKKMLAAGVSQAEIDATVYKELYDSTLVAAQQKPELNRFKVKGTYKSASGSDIALNALNVPEGSVVVTAGGVVLQENIDYTVDYNLGRVKILNQGLLESQTPIKISLESNSLFSVQQKTMMGGRFDYRVNKDFNLGATVLNLRESPITQKVNFGDDPINNTILGFDANYSTKAPFLTKLVDRLPFIDTKEESNITVSGEIAKLIPGHSKAIGEEGSAYIDDFEGSQSTIDLRSSSSWSLASTPQGQADIFPEGAVNNDVSNGYKRAQFSWYTIDPLFFRDNSLTPDNINVDIQSDHKQREVLETEVFPNRELPQGTPNNIAMLDLSFYPKERGPYNYTPNLEEDGSLMLPQESWGGIQRRLTTTDFENANVEFIQFWVMDPFNDDSQNQSGGYLYFNLGNISEDVLRDGRKSFENGFPKAGEDATNLIDSTAWGFVPTRQSIINAFDNTNNSNTDQDIGLDGLSDTQEQNYHKAFLESIKGSVSQAAFSSIEADPSNDNYHYYRGSDYDGNSLDIINRYKRFNGMEGNSPTPQDSPEDYPVSATSIPSTEDINLDNNLAESESYFQYRVRLDPSPDSMAIGSNYITDYFDANPDVPNGETKPVRWYQFKIPIRVPQKKVGSIQDFRSIRFMRTYLRGFSEPVTLRFARLELVRGEWRRYLQPLVEADQIASDDGVFDVNAVNIEENSNRTPVNYVLPPGISREIDASSTNTRQINEQSLSLTACGVPEGNAKAAFRNVQLDVRQYKKMRMYIHAESLQGELNKGDVTVFVRLGTDFDDNYYEYELPVSITDAIGSVSDPDLIWPEENNMVIDLEQLIAAKLDRDGGGVLNADGVFIKDLGDAKIRVKGNPTLSDVKTIMIGVRNPVKEGGTSFRTPCVEVWVNELRLTDFEESGGMAAVGRINAKLADFAMLNVAGNISTPGWGGLEQKVNERQRETRKGIDATSNFEMGKFLPEKTGIKIPMYIGYSQQKIVPQYDPLKPDVKFEESQRNVTARERRNIIDSLSTITTRKSFNLTDVRKERVNSADKPRFYDVENISVSYAYSETDYHDPNITRRLQKNYKGSFNYVFQNKPKVFEPFKNSDFAKSKHLRIIKDININQGINQFAFNTSVNRDYSEQQIRNNIPNTLPIAPTYTHQFDWLRNYDFKYDLSKNLKFGFNATNKAIIDEPGRVVNKDSLDRYSDFKDTAWTSVRNFGVTTNYGHSTTINYQLPIDKLPYLKFLNVGTNYSGSYNWERIPFSQDDENLGNTIQNNSAWNWSGSVKFVTLYNSLPAFKKVIKKQNKSRLNSRNISNRIPRLKGKLKAAGKDSLKPKKKEPKNTLTGGDMLLAKLMMFKDFKLSYTRSRGMLLPGFSPFANMLGMDNQFGAPGTGFVLGGKQNGDAFAEGDLDFFPNYAASKGWLVENSNVNKEFTRVEAKNIKADLKLEPFKAFRVGITLAKDESYSLRGFYRFDSTSTEDIQWALQNPVQGGAISFSTISIGSAFTNDDKATFDNATFSKMLENRTEASALRGEGYSGKHQDVLINSFLAAYGNKSVGSIPTDFRKIKPRPNWTVNYDGLSKIPAFRKVFRSVSINHGYRSNGGFNYTTNLVTGLNINLDQIPDIQISTITIAESFSPLLGIDLTWKNSLTTKVEYKKERQLALSLASQQLNENKSTEWVFGAGYRFKNVKLPFKVGEKEIKSDLNVRADVSIRDNLTVIRKIEEETNDATAGRNVISIKTFADYTINQSISVRAFVERQITKPKLSIPFPTYNTNAGITIRLNLTQ